MRIIFTTILLTISLTVSAQKKSLHGKYTHSAPYYHYFLTLKDSAKFLIEEHSDTGLRTTTGTWTINGHLIKLTPSKFIWDLEDHEEGPQELPLSFLEKWWMEKESFISVDKKKNLTKLAPKKKPDWWADSIKYDIPDYKLAKISK